MSVVPHDIDTCTDTIKGKLLDALKALLTDAYSENGVYRALMQMAPLKALSPDGFSVGFYQQRWAMVGPEVCNVVLHFLNGFKLEKNINVMHIALISKKKKKKSP
jgi:hypothetical protein